MYKSLKILFIFFFLITNAIADVYQAKSFNCTYYHLTIGEIKNNKYKVDSEKEDNFDFSIINIDLETKKSQLVGNNGTDVLTVINAAPSGIHFLQIMPVGNMTMTTIYPQEVGINKYGHQLYSSSHSRHMAMVNQSLPQQFYGECAKTE